MEDLLIEKLLKTKEVLVLDTVDYKEEITTSKIHQFIKNGKKVIIVALKSSTQINYVKNYVFRDSSFVDKPILIIDDEGDEVSLNTLVSNSKHFIRDDGGIPNYSVGRRSDDYDQPAVYLGDDKQFIRENTMQLQIHMIEDINSGIVSPTLSIHNDHQIVFRYISH